MQQQGYLYFLIHFFSALQGVDLVVTAAIVTVSTHYWNHSSEVGWPCSQLPHYAFLKAKLGRTKNISDIQISDLLELVLKTRTTVAN